MIVRSTCHRHAQSDSRTKARFFRPGACSNYTCSSHTNNVSEKRIHTAWKPSVKLRRGAHAGLFEAAQLLSIAFDDEAFDRSSQWNFQLRLQAALFGQAVALRDEFITLSIQGEDEEGTLLGIATLAPNQGIQALPSPLPCSLQSTRFAVLSNMAVDLVVRQQGLGRALLAECERVASAQGYTAVALLVHQYNEPAVRLYESSGYLLEPTWVDAAWLECAEKGRVGPQKRLLMLKQLPAGTALVDNETTWA